MDTVAGMDVNKSIHVKAEASELRPRPGSAKAKSRNFCLNASDLQLTPLPTVCLLSPTLEEPWPVDTL